MMNSDVPSKFDAHVKIGESEFQFQLGYKVSKFHYIFGWLVFAGILFAGVVAIANSYETQPQRVNIEVWNAR